MEKKQSAVLYDMTAEGKLETIHFVMNQTYFGRNESARIVGGIGRLMKLCEQGKIRAEKPTKTQNGKWFCNASVVLRYATVN